MNSLVPILLLISAAIVAFRHRSWRGGALFVATTTVLCGAGPDALPDSEPVAEDEKESLTFGVAGSTGRYPEACGPIHNYQSAAITAEYRREVGRNLDLTADLQVALAFDAWVEDGVPRRMQGVSFQPMIGLDHRFFMASIGGQLGQIIRAGGAQAGFPAARLRIGPRSVFFGDFGLADHFAGAFPGGFLRGGLGIGLPPRLHGTAWNHPVLRVGLADSGAYGAVEAGLGEQLRIDLFVSYGEVETWRAALGLQWRPRLKRR